MRLKIDCLIDGNLSNDREEGKDAIAGLSQENKSLPPRYFYDDRGSQLFEQICELPEYYPTRTETEILQAYGVEIAQKTGICELLELGSGSSTKTRLLLDAYQKLSYPLHYLPIDISAGILKTSAEQLLADYPNLTIQGLISTYELALRQLPAPTLPKRMICFLGSTLGNFTQAECDRFFAQITTALYPGDYFLLGIDLQKASAILEAAYNDSQGITAAFNLNMLQHLNWRFQGNFDLNLFQHQAIYNQTESQIEMYLIAQTSQTVTLAALDLTVEFRKEEKILTEISRKFEVNKMQIYLQDQGLNSIQIWTDVKQWFGVILAQKR